MANEAVSQVGHSGPLDGFQRTWDREGAVGPFAGRSLVGSGQARDGALGWSAFVGCASLGQAVTVKMCTLLAPFWAEANRHPRRHLSDRVERG